MGLLTANQVCAAGPKVGSELRGRIVERQRKGVSELASSGRSKEDADHTPDLFERIMALFEQHLRELTKGSP